MKIWTVLFLCSAVFAADAATYYVDNTRGDDRAAGTQEKPFASIERGIRALKTSDRLEVVNTGKPYVRAYPGVKGESYFVNVGGTENAPLVINGNGAVISGLAAVPADRWEKVSGGIVRTGFWPMSNRYRSFVKQDYWMPNLKIWFVDGQEAVNALSLDALKKTPGSFWWSRSEQKVYFHLPEGKTLEQCRIQLPANAGFYALKPHTEIRDFTVMHSWNDGFDTAVGAKNVRFVNCIAVSNCGQGFSAHEDTEAVYENCLAMNCGSAGICNVDSSKVEFRGCVIADNVFEPGVSTTRKAVVRMKDCLILDNSPSEQCAAYGDSIIELENCVVRGLPDQPLLFMRNPMKLTGCTLMNGHDFCSFGRAGIGIEAVRCIIGRFATQIRIADKTDVFKDNVFYSMPGVIFNGKRGSFQRIGADGSLKAVGIYLEQKPSFVSGTDIPAAIDNRGASVPAQVWELYRKYHGVRATPDGLISPDGKAVK